jgi:hypothetical protein
MGASSSSQLFWNLDNQVWNNDGDTATLRNAGGKKIHKCGHSSGASKVCPK